MQFKITAYIKHTVNLITQMPIIPVIKKMVIYGVRRKPTGYQLENGLTNSVHV